MSNIPSIEKRIANILKLAKRVYNVDLIKLKITVSSLEMVTYSAYLYSSLIDIPEVFSGASMDELLKNIGKHLNSNLKPKTYTWFKVTKSFQGGKDIYYVALPKGKELRKTARTYQLSAWGECTNGGHNYGYTINMEPIKRKPTDLSPRNTLQFDSGFLDDIEKSKITEQNSK